MNFWKNVGQWVWRTRELHYFQDVQCKPWNSWVPHIFGLDFFNPIGLAAGFDKNVEVINPLLNLGFGFIEAGTITPKYQYGNSKPRIFRLLEDNAIINHLGFNNYGSKYAKV